MNDFQHKDIASDKIWYTSRFLERCLFLLIILMEAGIFIYLIHERRIVGGHDGFTYFSGQYYVLNNFVNCGEIPQWTPFLTHGSGGYLWGYILQNGLFQNILLFSGSLLKDINFLPLFYVGIFLDELLLLVGAWLLSRRFFASPVTTFFVTLSIMGSCIWILQPWWNFHLYYAIPLIIYFIHKFLDSGKLRYYLLAGNLFFVQCFGNILYFLPLTSLIIFTYFLFFLMLNHQETLQKIKGIPLGWPFILITLSIIISFAILYAALTFGTDQIANYSPLRNPDGTTTLDSFLNYGGEISWKAWLEMILGISPCLDYTLYTGILCVPFIISGILWGLKRQNGHFLFMVIVLLLFSMGTFVSAFFYYGWPMMKYFRHVMLVSPIIKVFLCFLAGVGFDAVIFKNDRWKNHLCMKIPFIFIAIFMLGLSIFLWILVHNYEFSSYLLRSMVSKTLPMFTILFNDDTMISMLNRTTLISLIAFILFASQSFIKQRKHNITFVVLLLIMHGADIYGFKLTDIKLKSTSLNNELYKMIQFQPMPYAQRRTAYFWDNPRSKLLKDLPIQEPGAFCWSINAFLFLDELGSSLRTDHWMLPMDHYMKAYWGQKIDDASTTPVGKFEKYLAFPQNHPAALKISGFSEDKIQFFSHVYFVSSDKTIASHITNPHYKGDTIFLTPTDKYKDSYRASDSTLSNSDLSSNRRFHYPYKIQRFDANNLQVTTHINDMGSAWLLFSDIWHPLWRATVNGKKTTVYKANLAYKAVKLEKGMNNVHFYFYSNIIFMFHIIFFLNALSWLILIVYMTVIIVFHPSRNFLLDT